MNRFAMWITIAFAATLADIATHGVAAAPAVQAGGGDQAALVPVLNAGDRVLRFDWPALRIGTGEYEEGPTGLTVFYFPTRASAAVDVRGGSPGTANTDYLRQGYPRPLLDAVVFTAGIGEHAAPIRERVCRGARWLGIELDQAANSTRGSHRISTADSGVLAWMIPTNEELMIARHTLGLISAT